MKAGTNRKLSLLSHCRYGFETTLAYLAYGFFWLLPPEMASGLGGWIFSGLGPRLGVSRVALRNLDLAFPDKAASEKNQILRGMWDNLGRLIGEYPHLPQIGRQAELRGIEHIEAARDSGKPAILFCGHLANWELPTIRQKTGLDLHVVYRKPNNSGVDRLLRRARRAGCASQIEKGPHGAREIVSMLRKGGVIGMFVDQKMNEGLPIPFFGHDAMTAQAIAHFALKFKCPLYPFRIERLSGCRFRITVLPAQPVVETARKDEDVKRILTNINLLLESWIRERPEQWLWIHRRWPKDFYSEQR